MHVITIVNTVSATSMPINEFVLYRNVHNYSITQSLIVCDIINQQNVKIPNDIDVNYVGKNIWKIREVLKKIINTYNKDNIIIHLNHEKSAILFYIATIGLKLQSSTLYTVHSTYGSRNLKYKILSCIATLFARYIVCVSEAAYNQYSPLIKKIKKSRIFFITNGVDLERIDNVIEKKRYNFNHRKEIYYVARMIPIKNHEFLVKLMNRLSDYQLVLIGKEDSNKKIRKLVEKYNLSDRVIFKGLISRNEVFECLKPGAIYASPSLVEGMPVSVLEAMRCRMIPIVSNIEPHREIAKKCNEIKVINLDENEWFNSIKKLEEKNNDEIKVMCEKIKKDVELNFSLKHMQEEYIKLYERMEKNNVKIN